MATTSDIPEDVDADRIRQMYADPEARRQVLNPFEDATWREFAEEVSWGYMQHELDEWKALGGHHNKWLEELDTGDDFVLLCHRDGLKTTIVTIYLLACLEYKDGFRAHWITNTQDQAFKKAHEEFNLFVERNPWLTNLNADRENNSKSAKTFANGSKLYAGWLFGGIEGDRSHLLILDDVIKERGDGSTEDILSWIEGVTVPMVKEGGRTAIVGTRKSPDDIYSHFRSREGYNVQEYPAILDEWDAAFRGDDDWRDRRPDPDLYTEVQNPWTEGDTLQVLWPEARGPEWLADKRQKMSAHLFWREYTLTIRGASGNLIDETDINQLAEDGGCSIRGESPPREYRASSGEFIVTAHDPAVSPTGDYAAFVTFLIRKDGTRVLLDAQARKGLQPSQLKAILADLDDRYDPALIAVESNGMQQYVVNDALEMGPDMRAKVKGVNTTGTKHSWENGIPRLQTLVENGGMHFYRGDEGTESFIHAALSLELKDGKLDGHTPDLVAAWYMSDKATRALAKKQRESDSGGSGATVGVSSY